MDLTVVLGRLVTMDPAGAAADAAEIARIVGEVERIAARLRERLAVPDGNTGVGATAAVRAGAELGDRIGAVADRLRPAQEALVTATSSLTTAVGMQNAVVTAIAARSRDPVVFLTQASTIARVLDVHYSDPIGGRAESLTSGGPVAAPAFGESGAGTPGASEGRGTSSGVMDRPREPADSAGAAPFGRGPDTGSAESPSTPGPVGGEPGPGGSGSGPAAPGGAAGSDRSTGPDGGAGPADAGARESAPAPIGGVPAPIGLMTGGTPQPAAGRTGAGAGSPTAVSRIGSVSPVGPATPTGPTAAGSTTAGSTTAGSTTAGSTTAGAAGGAGPRAGAAPVGGPLGRAGALGAGAAEEQRRRRPDYLLSTEEAVRLLGPMPLAGPSTLGEAPADVAGDGADAADDGEAVDEDSTRRSRDDQDRDFTL